MRALPEGAAVKTWFRNDGNAVFACTYLPEFSAQALLRLRQGLRDKPVGVVEGRFPHERVCAGNAPARRHGLRNGMTRVEAESLAGVVVLQRSKYEEEAARAALLHCAGSFTPKVETCHTDAAAVCVLDIGGMTRFGSDPWAFARAFQRALLSRGLDASIAICMNFHAARTLAQGAPGIAVAAPGEEQQALAPVLLHMLSWDVLELSEEQAHILSLWGISTLGGLAALPQKELIARMGQSGKRLRELARGEYPHLFAPAPIPWQLREEFVFDMPTHFAGMILPVLAPMLDQLILQAKERALAIAKLTVTFALASGGGEPGAVDLGNSAGMDQSPFVAAAKMRTSTGESLEAIQSGTSDLDTVHRSTLHLVPSKIKVTEPSRSFANTSTTHSAFASGSTYQCTVECMRPTQNKQSLLRLLQLELAARPPQAPVVAVLLEGAAAGADKVKSGLSAPS